MSETLSFPSLLFAGLLLFLAARYLLSPRSPASASGNGRRASSSTFPGARRVDTNKVEQVAQMFPQLDRRAIAWDLARNGGSVGATAEKVLGGRTLDDPPPSFHPPNLNTNASTATSSSPSQQSTSRQDLITRYNLSSKLSNTQAETSMDHATSSSGSAGKSWAATKAERATLLAKRREEMILKARRRMEQKGEATGGGGGK